MDDNENSNKNQQQNDTNNSPQEVQPEEVAPNIEHPEEIAGSIPPEYPTDVPVYEESNNKMMFIIGIIVFFLVVFGAVFWFFLRDQLFPPSDSAPTDTAEVTLTYWGLWDEKEIFDPLIQEYQSENPHITINYEVVSKDQYRERLIARSQAGNGPDIFRFHNTWLPEIQEIITPLPQEVMNNAEFEAAFYPIHQRDMKIGESYYGIPLMIDGTILIYNDALLKQAGVVSPPSVWVGAENDVLSVAQEMTVVEGNGNIVTSGIAVGTANNVEHYGEIFGILLLLNGGDFKDLTTQEAAEALQLYRKFAEDGYWSAEMPNSIAAFIQGRTAMVLAPSWQLINIKSQNPGLQMQAAPVPKGLDDSSAAIASYWVEGVNRFSQNQTEAWRFLEYLSQREQLITMHEQQAQLRPFGVAYPRQDMAELLLDHQYLGPVIRQAQEDAYVSLPLADRTFDDGMNEEILQYIENAISSTAEGVDYSAALSTAQSGISTVLERYRVE